MADQTTLDPAVLALIAKVESGGQLSPDEFNQLVLAARNLPPTDPDFMRIAKAVSTERMAGMSEQGAIPGMKSPQLATATPSSGLATNAGSPAPAPTSIGDIVGMPGGALKDFLAQTLSNPGNTGPLQVTGQLPPPPYHTGDLTPPLAARLPSGQNPLEQFLHAANTFANRNVPPPPHTAFHEDTGDQRFSPPGLPGGDVGPADAIDPTDYSGYSFGGNLNALSEMFDDPEGPAMEALALAQQRGGSQDAAHFLLPYVQAAMKLAPTGALGASQGASLMGGPASDAQTMKAVEDFLNETRDKSVLPGELMGNVLARAQNTTPAQMQQLLKSMGEDVDASQLSDPNVMIKTTNDELTAAAQYLTPQARDAFNNLLAIAEINYKKGRADGKIMMTYPAFLEAIGLPQYFGAHAG